MILQYKGFNNNWVYVEVEYVTHAVVGYAPELRQKIERMKNDINETGDCARMKEIQIEYEEIEMYIKKQTMCCEITWLLGKKQLEDINNFTVLTLHNEGKAWTFVFPQGQWVYLLNSNGKTVQKF